MRYCWGMLKMFCAASYRFNPDAKFRNSTVMKIGMKYSMVLAWGFGGTPIWPTFESTNIERPRTIGMILYGSARERSGSQRNGTPRNTIVFANTKNSASSTGHGSSIGRQPPSGFTLYSL